MGLAPWVLLLAAFLACGPIPDDPTQETEPVGDLTTNQEWGFSIARPDSSWGISVITYQQDIDTNGLRKVEVYMLHAPAAGDSTAFEPTLFFVPSAVRDTTTIQGLVQDVDLSLSRTFVGYAAPDSVTERLTSQAGAEWQFDLDTESWRNFLAGVRFYVRVWLHNRKGFLLIGSGSTNLYPLDAYRQAASTVSFLD